MKILSVLFLVAILPLGLICQTKEINTVIEKWHEAAAAANYDTYFGLMAEEAVFIGTDATENWKLDDFKAYAKPHFDKGKAWNFTTLHRNIYTHSGQGFAWFDELLDTQMGICRGSGVLENEGKGWKIKHYVFSISVPNENVGELILLKKDFDKKLMQNLRGN